MRICWDLAVKERFERGRSCRGSDVPRQGRGPEEDVPEEDVLEEYVPEEVVREERWAEVRTGRVRERVRRYYRNNYCCSPRCGYSMIEGLGKMERRE